MQRAEAQPTHIGQKLRHDEDRAIDSSERQQRGAEHEGEKRQMHCYKAERVDGTSGPRRALQPVAEGKERTVSG